MIEKAVLFAAGRGTRLGALTDDLPKPLLEVRGRPIIVRILEGLIHARVTEFAVITGYRAEQIEYELGNGAQAGVNVRYFRQEQLDGTARALALARRFVGDDSFLFAWGDVLVGSENYRSVIRAAALADGALAVNDVDDPWAGAAVYVDSEMRVERIVEKPPRGTSATRWNNAGLGVLGPAIWPELERLEPSERGEYELPRAIAAMVAAGADLRAVPVQGPWFDIGTPENLEAARRAFGEYR